MSEITASQQIRLSQLLDWGTVTMFIGDGKLRHLCYKVTLQTAEQAEELIKRLSK